MSLKSEEILRVKDLLQTSKNIVITTHRNPDGDAIGSSLGLYNYLIQKKHKVSVIVPNNFPNFLRWMPGENTVLVFEKQTDEAKKLIQEADVIFCLDFNVLHRIELMGEEVASSKAFKITIDHHPQPEYFADVTYSDVKSSSTCEMIFQFIEMLGDADLVNKECGECLYTGIVTDTGSFKFDSTSPNTHRVAARLIEAGVRNSTIHSYIYDTNSLDRMRLLGYCLSEKLQVVEPFNTGYISLSWEDQKKFNYKTGDTEGIVNYALSIKGVKLAALFIERENKEIKISFRSKGGFSVNQFSRSHFQGGGHVNAAGGMSELPLDETINKFIGLLAYYKDELQNTAPHQNI